MQADYFTRYESQLTGGLGRLYRGGAVFSNAFQDHGVTETTPGHAAIRAFAAAARRQSGVERADLVRDLPRADTANDAIARRWIHALPQSSASHPRTH